MLKRPLFAYDPGSRHFALAVGAQKVQIWRLEDQGKEGQDEPRVVLDTAQSALVGLAFAGQKGLITLHETGQVFGWDIEAIAGDDGAPRWSLDVSMVVSEVAAFRLGSTGDTLLALGGESGQIALLDTEGGQKPTRSIHLDDAHADKIEVLGFSADGTRLASSGRDREISIWDLENVDWSEDTGLEVLRRLSGSGGWQMALRFSSDNLWLASGCMDNGVYLWNLEADKALRAVRFEHHGWVEAVEWGGDDDVVISGSWDNSIGVFDGATMAPQFQFMHHDDYVVSVLPIPGTTRLFAGSYDGDITVWDWRQGHLEGVLEGHSDWVTDLVWLGDGLVASISSDRTVRLWSASDLSQQGILGKSELSNFELGGDFDLASFGLGAPSEPSSEDGGHKDASSSQKAVVRRFDKHEPGRKQAAAISMLDQAVEKVESVGAEPVEAPSLQDSSDDAVDDSDEPRESAGGVGDELSDMVLDAISDVDDQSMASPPIDDDPMELLDAAGNTSDGELSDTSDPFDEIDVEEVPDADLDQPLVDRESPPTTRVAQSDDPAPTSGPLYDPKPVGPDDDLDEILPDDDELEQAFSSSVSGKFGAITGDLSPIGTGPGEEEDEETGSAESKGRDVDRDEATSDGDEADGGDSPGKDEPSSAQKAAPDEVGGGNSSPWMRGRAPTTLTRAKPLSERAVEGDESSATAAPSMSVGADRSSASDDEKGRTSGNTTLGPFSKERGKNRDTSPSGDNKVKDDEARKPSLSLDRSKLSKLAKKIGKKTTSDDDPSAATVEEAGSEVATVRLGQEVSDADDEAGAPTQMLEGQPELGGQQSGREEEVDESWGNKTLLGGMRPYSADDDDLSEQTAGKIGPAPGDAGADEGSETAETSRRLRDFQRSDRFRKSGPRKASLKNRLKKAVRSKRSSRQVDTSDRGDGADEDDEADESGDPATPSEQLIQRPSQLWQNDGDAVPPMAILRRSRRLSREYQPRHQLLTEHHEGPCLAIDPYGRTMVTAGQAGGISLWSCSGQKLMSFGSDAGPAIEVEFVEEDRLLCSLHRAGEIHLWRLPEADGADRTKVQHVVIGEEGADFRCGSVDPTGKILLVGRGDGSAQSWSLDKGSVLSRTEGRGAPLTAVAFGQKGPITASVDGRIRFWNDRGLLVDQIDTEAKINGLAVAGGLVVWTESSGGLFKMPEGASRPVKLRGHFGAGCDVTFRSDGLFLSAGDDGRILLYDMESTQPLREFQIPAPARRIATREQRLAVGCPGGKVFVFSAVKGK